MFQEGMFAYVKDHAFLRGLFIQAPWGIPAYNSGGHKRGMLRNDSAHMGII